MKKYIIGGIIGALIMVSGQVMAEEISKIGKVVQGEAVVIKGSQELSKALIVDGKSYAPVRDIVESFGSTATYEKGVISIESPTSFPESSPVSVSELNVKKSGLEYQIKLLNSDIDKQKRSQLALRSIFDGLKDRSPDQSDEIEAEYQKEFDKREKIIKELQTEIIALQTQLAEVNKQIAELESAQ